MAVSDKLLEARAEVKRINEIIEALEPRVLSGDARARTQLNDALRRRDTAVSALSVLEEEDRIARGLPHPVPMPAPMYGPPPVGFGRSRPREEGPVRPAAMYGPPSVPRRGWFARLFGRK